MQMRSSHTKEMEMQVLVFLLCTALLHIIRTVASPAAGDGTSPSGTGSQRDRAALLAFKFNIKNDPQGVMTSWNESLHFCDWQGVTCGPRKSRVTILELESRGLVGSLSPYIGNLSYLRELKLSSNTLQGEIPPEIGRLFSLQALDLRYNSLKGKVPANLSHCLNLVFLNLSNNKLEGEIPVELTSLSKLRTLSFARNDLTGNIPPSIGNLTSLEILSATANLIGGSIPDELGQLRNLKNLQLTGNELYGEIPMKGVFTNVSAVSVVGNKKLCGGILELQLLRCTTKESKRTKMSFKLILIISIVCALVVVSMVSSLLFCWFKKKRKASSWGSISLRESFLKVSYRSLLKATDGFSSINLIGAGSFSSVYKGILDWDGTVVAIKVLNLQFQGASKSFMAECETLRNIRHRNLVKILTCCSSVDFQGNDFKALVYEFMPNGSLERWLHPNPEIDTDHDQHPNLNLLQRINIAIDVACALDYLHYHCQKPIVHCDLKPSNILLNSDMTAHVGDFGLAKFLPDFINLKNNNSIGIRGTIGYVAPEYGLGSEVSISGDVYSYGILLLEMMIGKRPTDGMFAEGLNLHNFASTALPDQVMQIVDPTLLNDHEEEATIHSNQRAEEEVRNGDIIGECLVSIMKIGVACSMESPQDRMDKSSAIHELHLVRNIIQGTA